MGSDLPFLAIQQEVEGEWLPEIGYLIHRPYWRQGYASEAASAVRTFGFEVVGAPSLYSLIRQVNEPSQSVARKLGMSVVREVSFHGLQHLLFRVGRC